MMLVLNNLKCKSLNHTGSSLALQHLKAEHLFTSGVYSRVSFSEITPLTAN